MIATKNQTTDVYQEQADLCRVLNHPVRWAILDILRDGEQCVCHMEAMLGLRQAYISQHLMVLRDADLVESRREGWSIYYHVSRPEIYEVIDAMGAVTHQPLRQIGYEQTSASCPCPKCNKK